MKNTQITEVENLINNIRKIMNDRKLTQSTIAEYAGTSPSQISKILAGKVQLSLAQVANIATNLNMRIIDLFTYPDVYKKAVKTTNLTRILVELDIENDELIKLRLKENILNLINK